MTPNASAYPHRTGADRECGLTKREEFAARIFAATVHYCYQPVRVGDGVELTTRRVAQSLAADAVALADFLIDALNQKEPTK